MLALCKHFGRGHYALKAGYRDGRAVTAWSKGDGATQNDDEKRRWVTDSGVNFWVKGLAGKLGLKLPADLAEPWVLQIFGRAECGTSRKVGL